MKRLITFLVGVIVSMTIMYSSAQTDTSTSLISDSIAARTSDLVDNLFKLQMAQVNSNRYKMYQTDNIYNLLKLDTQTGRITQVQWSLKDKNEFCTVINDQDLSWNGYINSFELYPTQNIYQFILLDKGTGRTWHVQWGLSDEKRWIRRIY